MLLTKYGDFEFKCGGETYRGKPSFANIAKIGTPSQIIHAITMIGDYWIARKVLECCIDKPLPYFNDDAPISRLGARRASTDSKTFVINMARHCILHGVSGNVEVESDGATGKQERIKEFDPYEFIESAIELLEMDMEDAANLSMTEYITRVRNKPWYQQARKKEGKKLSIEEQKKLLDMQREMDRKQKEARK